MKFMKRAVTLAASMVVSFSLFATTAFAADYIIVPNDSLYKIGLLFDTPVTTLMADNALGSPMIYPGQRLKVPAEVYTVKNGDSLYLIGLRYGISLDALRKANGKWDSMLYPGQKLILPGIKPAPESANTVITSTPEEVNLLARLIRAEAVGEPYEAKVAVGAVVVNRVKSSDWPNHIFGVINQVIGGYYQFTPVKNGQINYAPTDDCIKAAWAALYGSDPSHGAMFYYDNSTTNQWILSKPVTARIGAMVFVK